MADKPSENVVEYRLEEDQELRFEVTAAGTLVVELHDGLAEMFGTELVEHRQYTFGGGARGAVFTWHGCRLTLSGQTDGSPYVAKIMYINTHAALEMLRSAAAVKNIGKISGGAIERGPRAMIVGPTDVGKSTYCKLLLNYAVRQQRTPTYVDLDVGQGSVSVPGTISALYVERPADIVDGFDKKAPLVYNYGHTSPGDNVPLYEMCVKAMAAAINARCDLSVDASVGGVVINTYKCLVTAAEAFEVDVVIVLDHERLYNELQRDLPSFVKISHQPKSGGVEDRTREMRVKGRRTKCRQYFYGTQTSPLYPHSFELSFDAVTVVRMGADELPASCLPIGVEVKDHRTQMVVIPPDGALVNHLLAVSMADTPDERVVTANVAGFVCVTHVDTTSRTMTVLSPQAHPLPSNILVFSNVTYIDDK